VVEQIDDELEHFGLHTHGLALALKLEELLSELAVTEAEGHMLSML
jgi:hypothetical protein